MGVVQGRVETLGVALGNVVLVYPGPPAHWPRTHRGSALPASRCGRACAPGDRNRGPGRPVGRRRPPQRPGLEDASTAWMYRCRVSGWRGLRAMTRSRASNHLAGLRFGVLPIQPVIPGHGVHHGLGEQGLDVIVLGVLCSQLAHGCGVGGIEGLPRRIRITVVALPLGRDQVPLPRTRAACELTRLPDGRRGPNAWPPAA